AAGNIYVGAANIGVLRITPNGRVLDIADVAFDSPGPFPLLAPDGTLYTDTRAEIRRIELRCAQPARTGCRSSTRPDRTRLIVRNGVPENRLTWKWKSQGGTSIDDFGDPLGSEEYELCLYDASGDLLFESTQLPGDTCGSRPCWTSTRVGFVWADKE